MIFAFASAFSSSILLALSFPGLGFPFLAWIGLVPFFISVRNRGYLATLTISFTAGTLFFTVVSHWLSEIDGMRWFDQLLFMSFLGTYYVLFTFLLKIISEKSKMPVILSAPVVWVSVEYLRSHIDFLSLPWALLGHSQYQNIPFIQLSTITGVYGLSFLIVMANAALAELVINRFRPGRQVVATLGVVLLALTCGFTMVPEKFEGMTPPVTVVQGNFSLERELDREYQKEIIAKQVELTRGAAQASETSLIVWPEGSVRGVMDNKSVLSQTISDLSRDVDVPLLVGSSRRPKITQKKYDLNNYTVDDFISLKPGEKISLKRRYYNSAFYFSSKGKLLAQYNKARLLPFGEYTPHRETIPWPARYRETDDFVPGNEIKIMELGDSRFGVLICWENIFPELFRKYVLNGADFMVNITNESWFGDTAAPVQFLSMSVFRAVENRVPVIRSANTGISCFIDPLGRITGKVTKGNKNTFIEGYLTQRVPLSHNRTFYTRYGDVFAFICIGMTLLLVFQSVIKPKEKLMTCKRKED
ncbi:apolipoprotein N-acyltransferase [Thermodesulfobacteriota bacterium]